MLRKVTTLLLLILTTLVGCTQGANKSESKEVTTSKIDFGNRDKGTTSLLKSLCFVRLESSDSCLVGKLIQFEVLDSAFLILSENGLFRFD